MSTAASLQAALIGQRAAAAQNAGGQANELIASALARAAQQRMQAAQVAAQLREQQRQRQIEAQLQTQQMLGSMFQNQANQQAALQRQLGEQEFQSAEARRERNARAGLSEAERMSRERIAQIEADGRQRERTPSQQLEDKFAIRAMNDPVLFEEALRRSVLGERGEAGEDSPEAKAAAEFLGTVDVSKPDYKARLNAIGPALGGLLDSLTPEDREKVIRTYKSLGGDESLLYQQPTTQPAAAPGGIPEFFRKYRDGVVRGTKAIFDPPQRNQNPAPWWEQVDGANTFIEDTGGPWPEFGSRSSPSPAEPDWIEKVVMQSLAMRPKPLKSATTQPATQPIGANVLRALQAQQQREQAMRRLMGMP